MLIKNYDIYEYFALINEMRNKYYEYYSCKTDELECGELECCVEYYKNLCRNKNSPDYNENKIKLEFLKNKYAERKTEENPTSCENYLYINPVSMPFICSPSFIRQAKIQLEKCLTNIGVNKYRENKEWFLEMALTGYCNFFANEGETIFFDIEEGTTVLYTQAYWNFQCFKYNKTIQFPEKTDLYKNMYNDSFFGQSYKSSPFVETTGGLLWIKCTFPGTIKTIDFLGKFSAEDLKFEIIDYLPKKFPKFDDLSEGLKCNIRSKSLIDHVIHYFDRVYDPAFCIREIKMTHDKIVEYYDRKNNHIIPKRKKEIFTVKQNNLQNYPNLVFGIYLKNGNASEASLDVEDAITNLNEKIEKKSRGRGFDYYDVQVKSENNVDLFIDFGDTDEEEYFTVLDTLSKLGLGIEKIIVD